MENASKALLIAAEVLIGVMILTTMIVLFTTFGDMGKEYNERLETQSIMQFNSQFTKYVRSDEELADTTTNRYLKVHDVLTIVNLALEWNNTGTNEIININIQGISKAIYFDGTDQKWKTDIDDAYISDNDLVPNSTEWKKYYISSYSFRDDTGRIEYIYISEMP